MVEGDSQLLDGQCSPIYIPQRPTYVVLGQANMRVNIFFC